MEISKRLKTIAGMVSRNSVACDVGTDHGYLAIYLIENKISQKVIAMDVAKGPLSKAEANIKAHRYEDVIETRLSNGLDKLNEGEADTVIMAGMGGILINSLLERGKELLENVNELILSPHTDIELVRKYLLGNGYRIIEEKMLIDEGKYYVIMKAARGNEKYPKLLHYRYGKLLLEAKDETLEKYMKQELDKLYKLQENLKKSDSENARNRIKELDEEIQCILEGLKYYEM